VAIQSNVVAAGAVPRRVGEMMAEEPRANAGEEALTSPGETCNGSSMDLTPPANWQIWLLLGIAAALFALLLYELSERYL